MNIVHSLLVKLLPIFIQNCYILKLCFEIAKIFADRFSLLERAMMCRGSALPKNGSFIQSFTGLLGVPHH